MHVTLHITKGCNLNCSYCYSPPAGNNHMTIETAKKSIDFVYANYPINTGLIFFGGEPLLRKEMISEIIDYTNYLKRKTGYYLHFKVTTNGTLLDEEFLKFTSLSGLAISISIDGNKEAHDHFRKSVNNIGSFDAIEPKIDMLLQFQPYAKALMTVSPETLDYYSDSFEFLIKKGFKYIIASLNYSADWTDDDVKRLKKQYLIISKMYEKLICREEKFYFSPFEMKLASHIKQDNQECYQCHLGKNQISISHNGDIYPCVQFVKDGISNTKYKIGDIINGINKERQEELYRESKEHDEVCSSCVYFNRCNNKCSCLNWQLTGLVNKISPKICECERVLIPIVDSLGKKLFQNKRSMFIQKHYNSIYPILSMIEDMKHS